MKTKECNALPPQTLGLSANGNATKRASYARHTHSEHAEQDTRQDIHIM